MAIYTEKPVVSVFDASVFDDEKKFNTAYSEISESRRKKVDLCRFEKDKKLSLAAGVLLERELQKLGVGAFEIQCSEKGKPHLAGTDIYFNLSHSGDFAAVAIYAEEVGVDIQQIADVSKGLIKKVTCEREYELLKSLDELACRDMFFRLWTVKESYLKYLGEGLGVDMSRLEVSFDKKTSIKHDGEVKNVVFEEYDINGYKMTVCYSSLS